MITIRQFAGYSLFFLLSFVFQNIFAQAVLPPTHERLLYSNDLSQDVSGDGATITHRDGTFIPGKGWEITTRTAQMYIELDEELPFEATLEFDISGLDLPSQVKDDWVLWALYSLPEADFYKVHPTWGSYALLKTDRQKLDGNKGSFNFFSASYRGTKNLYDDSATNFQVRKRIGLGVWDPNHTYHFRIVYNTEYI